MTRSLLLPAGLLATLIVCVQPGVAAPILPERPPVSQICQRAIDAKDSTIGTSLFRRATDIPRYQFYLERNPDGICAADARAQIAWREGRRKVFADMDVAGPSEPVWLVHPEPQKEFRLPQTERLGGDVEAEVIVAEDGLIEGCHITKSSGELSLDRMTCYLIRRRLEAEPGRDANGQPIAMSRTYKMHWTPVN